jgi:hypothetical protein
MLPFMMAPAGRRRCRRDPAEARKYANLAIEVLRKIARTGRARRRASASKALLDRGLGTVGKARMPDEQRERPLGKKEEAARAAEAAATGRYATPPPPRAFLRRCSDAAGLVDGLPGLGRADRRAGSR